jgi:NAD(P)-dependent dehydrogenase (short-subunit alcohol dehydrogenase family)
MDAGMRSAVFADSVLDGRVTLVTGGGTGLGRAAAHELAACGATVVIAGRRKELLEQTAGEIGRSAAFAAGDVREPADAERIVRTCLERHGRLDVLVNNAFHDGDFRKAVEADLDDWRQTMDVNLWGTLEMTRAAVPALREAGDGRVVMVNSMSVRRIRPRFGAYVASKAALEGVTKTLAVELGPDGIRVNGIHPGYIWGPNVEAHFAYQAERRGVTPDDVYQQVAAETCLRYLPPSSEIAGSVLFASDLSRPVTGQSLGVNAGHWLA